MNEIIFSPFLFFILRIVILLNLLGGVIPYIIISWHIQKNSGKLNERQKEVMTKMPKLRVYIFGTIILAFFFFIVAPLVGY